MGLKFANPIGLAAGLDKDAVALVGLASLGFGFVEVGTVTPQPQPGNPQPRLFRYPRQQALINRMGFNNAGVAALRVKLELAQARLPNTPVGVNIGKNRNTPIEQAYKDYLTCLAQVHDIADYVTLNLSSPNTPGLRALQSAREFSALLESVLNERERLAGASGVARGRVPIAVKIAPDLSATEIIEIAAVLRDLGVDAVIATNTTIARPADMGVQPSGGLSGLPLTEAALGVVGQLADCLQGSVPIIGVGGIDSVATAQRFLDAGADLLQIYTGLIFRGPLLVRKLVRGISDVGERGVRGTGVEGINESIELQK
jgi:dihydroorotate dehydrogenase